MAGTRIVSFTFPVRGHIAPTVPVVAALTGAGHHVCVATTAEHLASVRAAGADVALYPQALSAPLTTPSCNFVEVAALLAAVTDDGLLAFAMDLIRRCSADVVLIDSMAPWGRLAAELLGVPAVTSTASFLIGGRLAATPRAAAEIVTQATRATPALLSLVGRRRAIRSRYGADLGSSMRLLSNRAEHTIVFTSRALHPRGQQFGADVHFVGATGALRAELPYAGNVALSSLLARPPDRPLTYVSLGTIYHDRPQFIRDCISALAGPGRDLVVSVASSEVVAEVGPVPPGVIVCPLPPQLALLDRADLFVTHGGLGSVHEALWRGVPMVIYPQAADQPVVGARLAALGAATVLRGRAPSPRSIASAAGAMTAGPAAVRATELGRGLRRGGGAHAAAGVVLSACARPHSRPGS